MLDSFKSYFVILNALTLEPAPSSAPVAEALDIHEDGQKAGLLNLKLNQVYKPST